MNDITYRGFEIKLEKTNWSVKAFYSYGEEEENEPFSESEYHRTDINAPLDKKRVVESIDKCIVSVKNQIDKLYNTIPKNLEELANNIISYTEVDYGFEQILDPKILGVLVDNYYKNNL